MEPIKILSVDPGLSHTGIAILSVTPGHSVLEDVRVINLKRQWTVQFKLYEIYFSIFQIIKENNITDIALETPFLGKNAATFIKLGYIRGILLLLSEIHGLRLHEFAPQVIKKVITGTGTSDKEAVLKAVQRVFPSFQTPDYYDISDAIAIGLTALRTDKRLQSVMKKTSM